MSALDQPLGLLLVVVGVGALVGMVAYYAIAGLIERWRR